MSEQILYYLLPVAIFIILMGVAKNIRGLGMAALRLPGNLSELVMTALFLFNLILSITVFMRIGKIIRFYNETNQLVITRNDKYYITLFVVLWAGISALQFFRNHYERLIDRFMYRPARPFRRIGRPDDLPQAGDAVWHEMEPDERPRPSRSREWGK